MLCLGPSKAEQLLNLNSNFNSNLVENLVSFNFIFDKFELILLKFYNTEIVLPFWFFQLKYPTGMKCKMW